MLGKLLRDRVERIILGFSKCIDTILNWTELYIVYTVVNVVYTFLDHDT